MRDVKKWHKTAGVEKARHGKARHEKNAGRQIQNLA